MLKNNTKSQAALEFLTTYGWALAMIIVAMSAIGYYFMSPNDLMEDSCIFDKSGCLGFQVIKTSDTELEVGFEFNNPEPNSITINDVSFVVNGDDATDTNCDYDPTPATSGKKITVLNCVLTDFGNVLGDKEVIEVKVKYLVDEDTFPKYLNGEIIAKAR